MSRRTSQWLSWLVFVPCLAGLLSPARAADSGARPLRALLVTGGCCHDYSEQAALITATTSSNAVAAGFKIEWTVVQQGNRNTFTKFAIFDQPDWAGGYDVVVHNYCLPDVADVEYMRNVMRPHFEGVPAVILHCTVQSFRKARPDEWAGFVGLTSTRNEPSRLFEMKPAAIDHPILKGFPNSWPTPFAQELYLTTLHSNAVALASAHGVESGGDQVTAWVHYHGRGRVFGLTTGHQARTFNDPDYSLLLTRGMLWAARRLGEPSPAPGRLEWPGADCPR